MLKGLRNGTFKMKHAPDIVLAGFAKCGTSTLASQLVRMPEIDFHVKEKKEPHTYLFKWRERSLRGLARPSDKLLLDASTGYSIFTNSLEKIAKANENAMVIFILRDPIDRIYSNINWLRKVEKKVLPFDLQIAEAHKKPRKANFSRRGNYLLSFHASFYAKTILLARKLFPNVMIIYFDDLKNNQTVVLDEIRKKLNLRELDYKQESIVANATEQASYSKLQRRPLNFKTALMKAIEFPLNVHRKIKFGVWLNLRYRISPREERGPGPSDWHSHKIIDIIQADIELYSLAGIDLNRFKTLKDFLGD